jgi:hypothetical protein
MQPTYDEICRVLVTFRQKPSVKTISAVRETLSLTDVPHAAFACVYEALVREGRAVTKALIAELRASFPAHTPPLTVDEVVRDPRTA